MYPGQPSRGGSSLGIFLVFLVVGVYFLNLAFNFFTVPAVLLSNKIYLQAVNLVAGVLIILGGFKFLFSKKPAY